MKALALLAIVIITLGAGIALASDEPTTCPSSDVFQCVRF